MVQGRQLLVPTGLEPRHPSMYAVAVVNQCESCEQERTDQDLMIMMQKNCPVIRTSPAVARVLLHVLGVVKK